jgi:preprotein translocase subunit SecY
MVTVLVIQGIRKIPLQFAKRMIGRGINMPVSGVRDYIPVKVAAAGVMPIIFAQAIMFLPATVAQFIGGQGADFASNDLVRSLSDPFAMPYNIIYFFLVVGFTFVYTALLVNPQQYSEYLKRQNAFIPGVKPGKPTADFIDAVTTRVTLPGSVFLGLIAILPAIVFLLFGVNQSFAFFFGGTSLLILVGVVLDTLQQIESHLLMRKYDGLVKSGRIKGRSSMQTIGSDL